MKKKSLLKRMICFVLALNFAVSMLLVQSDTVYASPLDVPYAKKTQVILTGRASKSYLAECMMNNMSKIIGKGKITSVSSSNKKVAGVSGIEAKEYFTFTAYKYGKTTFTIKIKNAKGKTKKYKSTVTIVKYTNPASKIILGSSGNLASYYKKSQSFYYPRNYAAENEKISVASKSGWKLTSIKYTYVLNGKNKSVRVKNRSKINYVSGSSSEQLIMTFKNTKKSVSFELTLHL